MTRRNPNVDTLGHLLAEASFLLTSYHSECERNAASRETEFWRGNLSGFRFAVGEIYGDAVIHTVLEQARKNTGFGIPPAGRLDSHGKFLGADAEANF
jgi:hypothetical protein